MAGRTHSIIENEDCLLGVEENREILRIVREFRRNLGLKPYDEEGHRGLVRHCLIRKGFGHRGDYGMSGGEREEAAEG